MNLPGRPDAIAPAEAAMPEERFYGEIIERNVIISGLYADRERLGADVNRVSRLHLLPLVNAQASLRWRAFSLSSVIRGRARARLGSESVPR